jgi:hypothetical protein
MIITESNSQISSVLKDTFLPYPEQIRRMLGFLDDDEDFAWRMWWCPDGTDWSGDPERAEAEFGGSYLQAGGTAERMGVELRRREDDGEYRFYVVGREHDLDEPLTEILDVQDAHEPRHRAELFTADEAAAVFDHYRIHQTVPESYTLRLIADM